MLYPFTSNLTAYTINAYRALVYRSNVAKATCNPYWEQDVVDLATLVNNDVERDLQISIYDTPSRILLGYATTTIPGLVEAVNESGNADKALDIVKPSHSLLHSTTRQGKLVVLHASLSMANNTDGSSHGGNLSGSSFTPCAPQERQESLSNLPQAVAVEIMSPPRNLTFEDYVASNQCSLELCVAIDFTRGNGTLSSSFLSLCCCILELDHDNENKNYFAMYS
jgi:hypothetical protein